jgi:uncharacterized protein YukE
MRKTSGGLAVDPEALDAEAGALAAAATEAARLARQTSTTRPGGLSGWHTTAALAAWVVVWGERIAALAAELDDHAERLRSTARNYRDAEAENRIGLATTAGLLR